MSKKKPSSTSAGNTVPAAQPTAPSAERETRNAEPSAPRSALPAPRSPGAKAKPTAGPAETPATDDAAGFEQEATAFLQESINIGSDAGDLQLDAALAGKARRGKPTTADRTPVDEDAPAEDQIPGEDTADTEATGETPDQDESADTETDLSDDPENPDSETTTEAEAETETEDEFDDDDAALEATAAAKKWPPSFLRKIKRERRKQRRLEAQLDETSNAVQELREENERLKAEPAGLGSTRPGTVSTEEQKLEQQLAKVEETLDYIEEHPDGATIGDRQWTPEEMRQQKRAYERRRREIEIEMVDAKRRRNERAEALGQKLIERHPWMKDRKHPGHARVEEIVRMYPAFRDIPEARTMIADHLAFQGLLDRMARQTAAGNGNGNGNGNGHAHANGKPAANGNGHRPAPPAPRPPMARAPGKPGASPMPVNGRRASLQKQEDSFMETGDHEAGKALISSFLNDE